MVNGQTQIISLLENQQEWQNQTMTLLKSHLQMENQVSQMENLQTQMITQMVTTQTRMADSLDQMVRQLQVVHNPQVGNRPMSDPQNHGQETVSAPTITAQNDPITQTQNHQQEKTALMPTTVTKLLNNH